MESLCDKFLHRFTWTNLKVLPNLKNLCSLNTEIEKQLSEKNPLTMGSEISQKLIKACLYVFDGLGFEVKALS
jgi:hypothetical protein